MIRRLLAPLLATLAIWCSPGYATMSAYVRPGDTLSVIALRDASPTATLEQRLVVLYRTNPSAFDGNMNRLRAGAVILVPPPATYSAVTPQEALRVVRDQYAEFTKAPAPAIRDANKLRAEQVNRVALTGDRSEPDYTAKPVMREDTCLAMNVFYEARSEALDGQLAVAWVTMNRARLNRTTICFEVFRPSQFTWTSDARYWTALPSGHTWQRAQAVARVVLSSGHDDFTLGATHYHTADIYPHWAPRLKRLEQYGNHIFYRRVTR